METDYIFFLHEYDLQVQLYFLPLHSLSSSSAYCSPLLEVGSYLGKKIVEFNDNGNYNYVKAFVK